MFNLMKPIKGKDALAKLFNQYLKGLRTPITISLPMYTTVAEVQAYRESDAKKAQNFRYCAGRYYELTILRSSLRAIHNHVLGAISTLEGFYATYDDHLLAYAIDNRRKSINEYGSDDPTDWYRDNEQNEAEEWKVTHKDDPASLKHYTLHDELGRYFGRGDTRGEYIGTSCPEDFASFSTLVANQSEFSFRKMAEEVFGAKLVQVAEDGSHQPIPLADHIEREMNQDIKGADLVARFDGAMQLGWLLGDFYRKMSDDDLDAYHQLHQGLQFLRDVAINVHE